MSPLILVLVHAVLVYGHANREEIEAVLAAGEAVGDLAEGIISPDER